MKRSEAIKLLIPKMISPYEVIRFELYENGVYADRAERLLDFLEKELGMTLPDHKDLINQLKLEDKGD